VSNLFGPFCRGGVWAGRSSYCPKVLRYDAQSELDVDLRPHDPGRKPGGPSGGAGRLFGALPCMRGIAGREVLPTRRAAGPGPYCATLKMTTRASFWMSMKGLVRGYGSVGPVVTLSPGVHRGASTGGC